MKTDITKTKIDKANKSVGDGDALVLSYTEFNDKAYREKAKALQKKQKEGGLMKNELTELLVLMAAISWKMPGWGITILSGNPYPNTAGLLYKVKEVAKSEGTFVKRISATPMLDGENKPIIAKQVGDTALFKGIVEFGNGMTFEDIGEANPTNIKMSTIRPYANSMASRRATNRAMRLATMMGTTSLEEINEEENESNQTKAVDEAPPLTENEYAEIFEDVNVIDSVHNADDLAKAKEHLTKRKEILKEHQIRHLGILFSKKEQSYGKF